VACRAGLLHLNEQRVLVAVVQDLLYALNIAGRLALLPELVTRAAPETRQAALHGPLQRLSVHVRHHQDLTGPPVLDDGGDEALFIVFQIIWNLHSDSFYHKQEEMSRAPLTATVFPEKFNTIWDNHFARVRVPRMLNFQLLLRDKRKGNKEPASRYHETGSLSNHKSNYH